MYLEGLLIVLIIIVLYLLWDPTSPYRIRGITYNIHDKYENYQQAAKHLDEMNGRIIKFLAAIKAKYHVNTVNAPTSGIVNPPRESPAMYLDDGLPNYDARRQIVQLMLQNYNFEAINENDPATSNDTSYTIAKGKELHVCLRQKNDPNKFHNMRDLMFVILHELSHMGNTTYGHDARFWKVFKFVLHEAKLAGIHDPPKYHKLPINYCGLHVNYNPYYDENVPSIWLTENSI